MTYNRLQIGFYLTFDSIVKEHDRGFPLAGGYWVPTFLFKSQGLLRRIQMNQQRGGARVSKHVSVCIEL